MPSVRATRSILSNQTNSCGRVETLALFVRQLSRKAHNAVTILAFDCVVVLLEVYMYKKIVVPVDGNIRYSGCCPKGHNGRNANYDGRRLVARRQRLVRRGSGYDALGRTCRMALFANGYWRGRLVKRGKRSEILQAEFAELPEKDWRVVAIQAGLWPCNRWYPATAWGTVKNAENPLGFLMCKKCAVRRRWLRRKFRKFRKR